jgi:hypothetical protein
MEYLGPCRQPVTVAENIIEQCGLAKFMGDAGLTDFDPLIKVMHLVAEEVEGLRLSLAKPKGRKAWCEVMTRLQEDDSILEHNLFIPCRSCDQAFEPVVDDRLLKVFLAWYRSFAVSDLLAIHRCPACGGKLAAKRTKTYRGDFHTPAPGSPASDEQWAELLLQHTGL